MPEPGGLDPEDALGPVPVLGAEDAKLVTLARSARARVGAAEGAAVRDETGRTYVGATVELPSLRLSALQAAVAAAACSGARGLEAAAVVTADVTAESALARSDLHAVRDLGGDGTPVYLARPDGTVAATIAAP